MPLHHFVRMEDHPCFGGPTPVLYLRRDDVEQPFSPLVSFVHAHSRLSVTSKLKPVRAFGFLYDYFLQTEKSYVERAKEGLSSRRSIILNEFCNALRFGTLRSDGTDPSGLWWPPCSSEQVLNGFGTWLDKAFDFFIASDRSEELAAALPFFEGVTLNVFGIGADYRRAKRFSFFAHISGKTATKSERRALGEGVFNNRRSSSSRGQSSALQDVNAVPLQPAKAFPKSIVVPFITTGFNIAPRSPCHAGADYTGRLYAAIAVGGGRGSESLHMWVNDLQIADGRVYGFLRHPERYIEQDGMSRERLLLQKYGRRPRTRVAGRERVGFKEPRLSKAEWALIHWLPIDGFQDYLISQLEFYLNTVRPGIMERRRRAGLRDHPYLLVTERHSPLQNQFIGDPLTRSGARYKWKRAIERLSRQMPNLVHGREFGTTRHGMRHRYGLTLDDLGVAAQDIQAAMHHRSIMSSLTYRARSDDEVHELFEEQAAKHRTRLTAFGQFGHESSHDY